MKLLQLNVWMGRLTRQILPLIEREQPDIITTQEMFSGDAIVRFPDGTFNLLEILKEQGNYEHSYFSPVCEFNFAGVKTGFGNGVLSKYPVIAADTVYTHGSFHPDGNTFEWDQNSRNAQVVTLDIGGQPLHIANHHGYWEPNPVGSEKTVKAMQVLADAVRKLDGPLLVAGDLNVDPGTPAMRVFDDWLEDLTGSHGVTNTLSTLGKLQGVAPDHILVSSDVRVKDFRVLDDLVSDHKALVIEFAI